MIRSARSFRAAASSVRPCALTTEIMWSSSRTTSCESGPVAFSPDGQSIVAVTEAGLAVLPLDRDGSPVALQDSTNVFSRVGTNLFPRGPPRSRIGDRVLAFSPDGRLVVAARNGLSERGVFVLSVWDAQSGKEVSVMPDDPAHVEHGGTISSLVFSPDGRTLATASMDHSVRLWDFEKRVPLMAIQGHLSEVFALAFTPDGQTIISGAKDGEVKLWPAHPLRNENIVTTARHPQAFARDGKILAAMTRDSSSMIFINATTGETEKQFDLEWRRGRPGPFGFSPISFSEDLRTMAQSADNGVVRLWDTATHEATTLKVADGGVDLVVVSPNGKTLITRARDHVLRRWDLASGTNVIWATDAFRISFSPDGRLLVYASNRGGLFVRNPETHLETQIYRGGARNPSWGPPPVSR